MLETVPVEPYELDTAEAHGRLLAHLHRSGTKRGAHDLIIAATAVATSRTVLTTDRNAHFEELPGVDCIVVSQAACAFVRIDEPSDVDKWPRDCCRQQAH